MKRIHTIIILVTVALLVTSGMTAAAFRNFRAHLSGPNEVPPAGVVIQTLAQGQAIFNINEDGSEIHYKLIVANIENVFQAHIHRGAAGVNGPVAVWLYPSTTPGKDQQARAE